MIVGLGNPGGKYRYTPHNTGFLVIERLARTLGVDFEKKMARVELAESRSGKEKIILARPLTFMNLSGLGIREVFRKKRIETENLLVICDDISLPLGKVRLRKKGSDGGHRGLRSIIQELQTQDFPRLRIGVGKPGIKDLTAYVLDRFCGEDWETIDGIIDISAEAVLVFVKEGINKAMNEFN